MPGLLNPDVLKWGPRTGNVGIPWELVRNAGSQAPPRLTQSVHCDKTLQWFGCVIQLEKYWQKLLASFRELFLPLSPNQSVSCCQTYLPAQTQCCSQMLPMCQAQDPLLRRWAPLLSPLWFLFVYLYKCTFIFWYYFAECTCHFSQYSHFASLQSVSLLWIDKSSLINIWGSLLAEP